MILRKFDTTPPEDRVLQKMSALPEGTRLLSAPGEPAEWPILRVANVRHGIGEGAGAAVALALDKWGWRG